MKKFTILSYKNRFSAPHTSWAWLTKRMVAMF